MGGWMINRCRFPGCLTMKLISTAAPVSIAKRAGPCAVEANRPKKGMKSPSRPLSWSAKMITR